MQRRTFLQASAVSVASMAMPHLAVAQGNRVMRFKPNADATIVDPVWTTAFSTRYLGALSYDTLYGVDNSLVPHPQMAAGHVVEDDGKRWRITLRDGLRFHDGTPVLARDAVASIKRWGARDAFGQMLMSVTDELSAASDTEIVFRLKQPFPLLPNALGKSTSYMPVIMPERLITDPAKQVLEVVGSGPFRYLAGERLSGSRSVWERFDGYVPRPDGTREFTSGPKVGHFDRVEWNVIPDAQTAAAALLANEIDWYEDLLLDLAPSMRGKRDIVVDSVNPFGYMGIMRFNTLQPPFDNPAIRRAILSAIDRSQIMPAVAGSDPSMYDDKVGMFCPGSPMASDAGLEVLNGPRDYDKARKALQEAGYKGETVGFLSAANFFGISQQDNVVADQLRRAGMTVELISVDFGTWLQRRGNMAAVDKGGWSVLDTFLPGLDLWDPAVNIAMRGNGKAAWPGWPTAPKLEDLREAWFKSPDLETRATIARDMQRQALVDLPLYPDRPLERSNGISTVH